MDNDREFNEGFRNMHYTAEYFGEFIGKLMVFEDKEENYINDWINKGTVICSYIDNNNEALCKSNGFEFTIDYFGTKYNCFGLFQYGNSTVFSDRVNQYDITSLIRFNGEQYVYSLYTTNSDINCSEIASTLGTIDGLGGGGHPGAAGFQAYSNIMHKDAIITVAKSLFGKTKINVK